MYASQQLHDMQCISLQKGCTRMILGFKKNFHYDENQQKYATVYKLSLPILYTVEGSASRKFER